MSRHVVERLESIGMYFTYGLAFTWACLLAMIIAQNMEHRFWPVVVDVHITQVEHKAGKLYLTGTMDKVRDCRFVEAVAYSGSKLLALRYMDDPDPHGGRSRSTGVQSFGPWELVPDSGTLRIVSRHECHALWDSTTEIFEGTP